MFGKYQDPEYYLHTAVRTALDVLGRIRAYILCVMNSVD